MPVGRKERRGMEKEPLVQAWVWSRCCGQLEKESVGKGVSMELSLGEGDQGGNMGAAQQGERGWRRSQGGLWAEQSLNMGLESRG